MNRPSILHRASTLADDGRSTPNAERPAPRATFWTYDPNAPSFRHRVRPTLERLRQDGWQCHVETLPRGRYGTRIVERRRQLALSDVLVLCKTSLGLGEGLLLRGLPCRVVFDFDDAIFVRQPRRLGEAPDDSCVRRLKFQQTCALADLVIAGNRHLAHAARCSARRVEIVPTSVEASGETKVRRRPRTLVWIGRPENLQYLDLVRPVLARLMRQYPDLRLRVICSRFPDWSEVPIEKVEWSEATEDAAIASAGIGLMPLADDAWTRGKCGFKLLQCMAQGLPCVASPVGANLDVLLHGVHGFLARDPRDWEWALRTLLDNPVQAQVMGADARAYVRQHFDRAAAVLHNTVLLRSLVGRRSRRPDTALGGFNGGQAWSASRANKNLGSAVPLV